MRNPAKNKEHKRLREARKLRKADILANEVNVSRGKARHILNPRSRNQRKYAA